MSITHQWQTEPGARIQSSRDLDSDKLQGPCIVRIPTGGFRLFYTAVGPAKPYRNCQGYLLSAISDDGLSFRPEPGIRLAPQPDQPHMSLRLIAPAVTHCSDGRWRMYFEARGTADRPTVICSAVSSDMLHWDHEEDVRLQTSGGVGGPRYLSLPDGRGRLYCFESDFGSGGPQSGRRLSQSIISATTTDGLNFSLEPGHRLRERQPDEIGITAAEVFAPKSEDDDWIMFFSVWQDVPPGTVVPPHPANQSELSEDFAAASIASDMAGYRSRIHVAHSPDGLNWNRSQCVIEGRGYDAEGLDAVHAEDMSLIQIGPDRYRMYYAACNRYGNWCIASAVTV